MGLDVTNGVTKHYGSALRVLLIQGEGGEGPFTWAVAQSSKSFSFTCVQPLNKISLDTCHH